MWVLPQFFFFGLILLYAMAVDEETFKEGTIAYYCADVYIIALSIILYSTFIRAIFRYYGV